MLHRLRTKWKKARFYAETRGILNTPPIEVKDAPWSVVSMVGNDDGQMYLIGMKSFYSRLKRGKLIAIIARDRPQGLVPLLIRHFPGIRIVTRDDIDTGRCQRGGTWERLVYILDLTANEYAIQMDCDVLASGTDVDEVARCAETNTAFTLGNGGRPIETMESIAADARGIDSNYIGLVSERLFDQYPNARSVRYVRASSAFAGFARGGFTRAQLEVFHQTMERIVGSRWREWGSEQCGSNFAIANSPGAIVLPYPKYANFWPGLEREKSAFLHFFGTHRYKDGFFAARAREEIARLMS